MLALTAFARSRASSSGVSSYCLPCHNERGKRNAAQRGGSRTYHLTRRYGITAEEADAMLASQEGLCAICRKAPAAHVDHDHQTGAVRALLCFNCNGGLGQFKDDPAVLRAAADYVEAHRRRRRPQPLGVRRDEVSARLPVRRRSGPRRGWSPMCTRLQAWLDARVEA